MKLLNAKEGSFIAATAVAIIFVIGLTWWTASLNEKRIRNSTGTALEENLKVARDSIYGWYREREGEARIWAQRPGIKALTKELLATPPTAEALLRSPAQAKVRKTLTPVLKERGYRGYFIVSVDGLALASSRSGNIGSAPPLPEDMVKNVLSGNTEITLPQPAKILLPNAQGKFTPGQPTMFVAAPMLDANGTAMALLAFRIDPVTDFSPILERIRSGKSGETYALNEQGRLISESRFEESVRAIGLISSDEHSILGIKARDPDGNLTRMAKSVLSGQAGIDLSGYTDYRGVPVIGAWTWVEKYKLGIATEIEVSEAYDALFRFRKQMVIGTAFTALLFMVLSTVFIFSRRKTVTSEIGLRAVIDNAIDGVIVIDKIGTVERFSPAAEGIFGYKEKEVLGRNIKMLMPEPYHGRHDGYLRSFMTTGEKKIIGSGREVTAQRKDGSTFPMDLAVSEMTVGDTRKFLGVVRNIEERKRTEKELTDSRDMLKDQAEELRNLAEKNAAERERAEQATKAKSEFLANMSHEIRTPMNAVIGLSYLALKTKMTPKQKDYISKINSSAQLLMGIINDILDFSKVEAGKLTLEEAEFDLLATLETLKSIVNVKAMEKGLGFHISMEKDVPTALFGDSLRLGQVLLNLTGNAVKFTEKGEITVFAKTIWKKGGRTKLLFGVRDTGIGLSEDQRETLFESFTQADGSTTRKYGGTGLGLSISKSLVELMSGKIEIESAPGEGSTFIFTAEFGLQDEGAEKSVPLKPRNNDANTLRGVRILLVEDNEINMQVAAEILKEMGAAIETAYNGLEAVAKIKDPGNRFDVVLMDLQMPIMGGIEATEVIRGELGKGDLPIIAMTAHALPKEKARCTEAGMNDHSPKPIEIEHLTQTLLKYVSPLPLQTGDRKPLPKLGGEAVSLPDTLPGIDLETALPRLMNNEALFKKLLVSFRGRFINITEEIRTALEQGDRETAERTAHTIRGAAGNLSAMEVSTSAAKLETAICNGEDGRIRGLLDDLSQTLIPVLESATLFTGDMVPLPNRPGTDSSALNDLLVEMNVMLRKNRMSATKSLPKIMALLKNGDCKHEIGLLEKHVAALNFKAARIPLKAIALKHQISLEDA